MSTKTMVALSAALFLGLCGTVMAGDSGENHQDGGNATGPNPFMTFSGESYRGGGNAAFAKQVVQPRVVNPRVKK
jgi:hypothetical protein